MKIQLKGNYHSRQVWIDGQELLPGPSQNIINHSPDGFAWGYSGSGPAQLALAILLRSVDPDVAQNNYQRFKEEYIATLPQEDFDISIDLDIFFNG